VVAAYILFYAGSIYFRCRLSNDVSQAYGDEMCRELGEGLIAKASVAISVSFTYLFLLPLCLVCALCCARNSRPAPRQAVSNDRPPPPPYSAASGAPSGSGFLGGAQMPSLPSFSGASSKGEPARQPMV
jgi:hypothetical protein